MFRDLFCTITISLVLARIKTLNLFVFVFWQVIKQLKSDDFVIHTIYEKKVDKLKENIVWTTILSKNARASIQTHEIMINDVKTREWNLRISKSKNIIIRKIVEQNSNIKFFQSMKIVWIEWKVKLTKEQKYDTMIIEIIDSIIDNVILNEHLMIERQIKVCSIFNKTCKFIQCFKCYHHEHTMIRCFKKKCEHCDDNHATQSNFYSKKYKLKCCVCDDEHKSWIKSCSKKKKKITKILYQMSITSTRFLVKRKYKVHASIQSYFATITIMKMN